VAAAAYLARYKGWSRLHNECDRRCWLGWCAERKVPPLTAQRVHIEQLFIGWLQEIRHFKPATVARAAASSASPRSDG
jgi:integrase/recombinase XerD